jgi:hypothetical protein
VVAVVAGVIVLVQPETVLRWHRASFRRFWRRRSRRRQASPLPPETIGLIRDMAARGRLCAGAIAVALAAAWAWENRARRGEDGHRELLEFVVGHMPDGETRAGIAKALSLPAHASVRLAVSALGNGSQVSSSDTVPFALWCAAHHLDDFVEAMWTTVSGLGDRDTTCAIVGGIVVLAAGRQSIPEEWTRSRATLAFTE